MTLRYYVSQLSKSGGVTPLPPDESQHAIRVMRVQIGDEIILFDGSGMETSAVITDVGRRECICDASAPSQVSRESTIRLHLGISLPKGDRAKEMVERLTELGVTSVTPLICRRTQREPSNSTLEKLARGVIEASKQCGRNQLLEIREPLLLRDYLASTESTRSTKWFFHTDPKISAQSPAAGQAKDLTAAVGPEGGWSADEVDELITSDFQPLTLGKRILRIETAAVAVASIVCCHDD